uniref:Uncharacterized protein n=1 Tax=Octopus bimaculoides TaxID=37653 RepID=A0A0L8HDD7_OCTBM
MCAMLHLPIQLWSTTSDEPSPTIWNCWKRSFLDYLELLPILQPTMNLSECHKIKLLHQFFREEGQRHFSTLRIMEFATLTKVFGLLNELCGSARNVYTACYCFTKLNQKPEKDCNDFIARIQPALPECEYNLIPPKMFENEMALQCLLSGIRDETACSKLLSEEELKLTWE